MPIRRGDHRSVPYSVEKIGLLDSLGSNTSRAEISAKRPSPHLTKRLTVVTVWESRDLSKGEGDGSATNAWRKGRVI